MTYEQAVKYLDDSGRKWGVRPYDEATWVADVGNADGTTASGVKWGPTREDATIQVAEYLAWLMNGAYDAAKPA